MYTLTRPSRRARRPRRRSRLTFALLLLTAPALTLPATPPGAAATTAPHRTAQQPPAGAPAPAPETGRTKIAEGEYAIFEEDNSGAVGPFGEEVYDFHETWTLWRMPNQRYEVRGERDFKSPKDTSVSNKFQAELSRDFTVLRVTEFSKLKWRKDSGPLTCEFRRTELHCSSSAHDPKQAVDLRIPSENPFGLLWPISVFSISGVARQAERDPEHPTPVKLITIEQPSAEQPIYPESLDGQMQYLGEDDIQVAGIKWEAHKFSFHVASHPQFLLWTSSKGLLLAFTVAHGHPDWQKEGLRLVRFQQFADF